MAPGGPSMRGEVRGVDAKFTDDRERNDLATTGPAGLYSGPRRRLRGITAGIGKLSRS